MKALVGAFNQEKALVGALSVIVNLPVKLLVTRDVAGYCNVRLLTYLELTP